MSALLKGLVGKLLYSVLPQWIPHIAFFAFAVISSINTTFECIQWLPLWS